MTVIEIRFCDPDYTVETYRFETTLAYSAPTPTIGWFSRSDWQRGIDLLVADPMDQNLPRLD